MRIRRVPRAWLDSPGSIPGRPGRSRRGSATRKPGTTDRRQRNEAVVRSVLDAFRRRDPEILRELVALDARLHIAEPVEGAGDFHGSDGIMERFARTQELLGEAAVHINDVLTSDSHAAVLFEVDCGTRSGPRKRVALYRISRGRVKEIRVHEEPGGALTA